MPLVCTIAEVDALEKKYIPFDEEMSEWIRFKKGLGRELVIFKKCLGSPVY